MITSRFQRFSSGASFRGRIRLPAESTEAENSPLPRYENETVTSLSGLLAVNGSDAIPTDSSGEESSFSAASPEGPVTDGSGSTMERL